MKRKEKVENIASSTTKYSFDDWIDDNFWDEFFNEGNLTKGWWNCYDSKNYEILVIKNKMTQETLNKIQQEQVKAYDYMIQNTLQTKEENFKRDTTNSLDLKKIIDIDINRIEDYINRYKDLFYTIARPHTYRGFKRAAMFITPQQYSRYVKKQSLSASEIFKRMEIGKFQVPTIEQINLGIMEVEVLWLKNLKQYLKQLEDPEHGNRDKALTYIEPILLDRFLEIEKKALEGNTTFDNLIRCASFCDLMYSRKYIKHSNNNRITMNEFSLLRYGLNIYNQLESTKNLARQKHINQQVKGKRPLKQYL